MSQGENLPIDENEPTQIMVYTKMDHTEPLRGELLHAFQQEMQYRSEQPLSSQEEGELKQEVADRLFHRSIFESVASLDPEAGLSLGGLHWAMKQAQIPPQSRPIEHRLYKAQEQEDDPMRSILQALKAAGFDQTITEKQMLAGLRVVGTIKKYEEFLALQTGQVDVVREQITGWQTSGQELAGFQKEIADEPKARALGRTSMTSQEVFNLCRLAIEQIAERYLREASEFAHRTHRSPADYARKIEIESVRQTFLNAVTALEPVAVQETGSPLASPDEILEEIAKKEGYILPGQS